MHLGLYAGYVKHLNDHYRALATLSEEDTLTFAALSRRIGFELAGVENHERYFAALEGGPTTLSTEHDLHRALTTQYGSCEHFLLQVERLALLQRGPGWVLVVYDKQRSLFHQLWVADHELGAVPFPSLLAIDMWEHAYLVDYPPSEKRTYLKAYLSALNWESLATRFSTL